MDPSELDPYYDYYEFDSCYCSALGRMAPCGWCTREIDEDLEEFEGSPSNWLETGF